MRKPNELRTWLLASVRDLACNPEKLQIYIDEGNLNTHLQTSLHFEYAYTLNLIVTDFADDPDCLLVPLLAWLKAAQPEMAEDAIKFEADVLDHGKVDLSITLPLTERVLVNQNNQGNYHTEHPPEPVPDYNLPSASQFTEIVGNEQRS